MIQLFNSSQQRIALARFGSSSRFNHSFGGTVEDHDLRIDPSYPLHLIYSFDTTDPLFPFQVNSKQLPLFYGFVFGGKDIAYRLVGNEIQLILPERPTLNTDFPYPGFPSHFDSAEVLLSRVKYNPHNHKDALLNAAFFGLAHIADRTLKKVAKQLNEFDFWDDEDLDLEGRSQVEYLRNHPPAFPFMQGLPNTECVYSDCRLYKKTDAMEIIAFQYFDSDVQQDFNLWANPKKAWAQNISVALIFQMCTTCETIYVSNQST